MPVSDVPTTDATEPKRLRGSELRRIRGAAFVTRAEVARRMGVSPERARFIEIETSGRPSPETCRRWLAAVAEAVAEREAREEADRREYAEAGG